MSKLKKLNHHKNMTYFNKNIDIEKIKNKKSVIQQTNSTISSKNIVKNIINKKNNPLQNKVVEKSVQDIDKTGYILKKQKYQQLTKLNKLKQINKQGCIQTKSHNIVVTVCNEKFKDCLLTLINSIYKTSHIIVNEIIVFNLGLSSKTLQILKKRNKVKIAEFNLKISNANYNILDTKYYGFKPYALKNCINFVDENKLTNLNIMYIDSGICCNKSIRPIFNIINKKHIFFVNHDDRNSTPKNFQHCHPNLYQTLSVNLKELNGVMIKGGFMGYKYNGKYQRLINEHYNYCQKREVMCYSKFGVKINLLSYITKYSSKNPKKKINFHKNIWKNRHYSGSRHDQIVLSILCRRYNCPISSSKKYAYSIDKNVTTLTGSSNIKRLNSQFYRINLNTIDVKNALCWIHRGTYIKIK